LIYIWSASDYDEKAWDGYFSNQIKGKKPDWSGGWDILRELKDKKHENQTIKLNSISMHQVK